MRNIKNTYPEAIIISGCLGEDEIQDKDSNEALGAALAELKLAHKQVKGVYKGQAEQSYYVECPSEAVFVQVYNLANKYQQESILHISTTRKANLVYSNKRTYKALGTFKQVSEFEVQQHEDYTYDPINNGYYICE